MPHCSDNCAPVNKICHIEIPSAITLSQPHTERIQQKGKNPTKQQNKPTTARKTKGSGPLKEQYQNKVHKLNQRPLSMFKEGNNKD